MKIIKAIHKDDWTDFQRHHHRSYHKIVDHKFHMQRHPMDEEYKKFLLHPEELRSAHSQENVLNDPGVDPKLIHDITDFVEAPAKQGGHPSYVMIKPYHQVLNQRQSHVVDKPLHGWSTMTTKALYHAGGLKHLIENVSVGEHNGIPITIHKFAGPHMKAAGPTIVEAYRNMWYENKKPTKMPFKINRLSAHQIAIMDYLTNNIDRHRNNLLVGVNKNQSGPDKGFNPILAIDHALSFQYNKPISAISDPDNSITEHDIPAHYIKYSAPLSSAVAFSHQSHPYELVEWWRQHGESIREEFYNQLNAIKSDRIKQHLRDNFDKRWNIINNWTKPNTPYNYQQISLFDESFPYRAEMIPMKADESTKKYLEFSRERLPKDPYEAAQVLATMTRGHPQVSQLATKVAAQLLKEMPDDKAKQFILDNYHHQELNIPLAIDLGILAESKLSESRKQMLHDVYDKLDAIPIDMEKWARHMWGLPK